MEFFCGDPFAFDEGSFPYFDESDLLLEQAHLPHDHHQMAPPVQTRKKKAPTLRAEAWEPYKARILELHIEQRRPLREVKQIIEEEFGFVAE